MTNWLVRGLAFAALMVVVRLIQGLLINTWESQAGLISLTLLLVFLIVVVMWGLLDGRDDANANPDPDRRQDLAMRWLVAGVVAGLVSGAVTWLVSLFDKALYVGGLMNELTTFAAFTALLVFAPAMAGVVVGRWLVDRQYAKVPRRHHGLAADDEDRADTDVFAAVSVGGDSPTAEAGGAAAPTAAQRGADPVADWPTEEFPADAEESTTEFPTESAEQPTTEIPSEQENRNDEST